MTVFQLTFCVPIHFLVVPEYTRVVAGHVLSALGVSETEVDVVCKPAAVNAANIHCNDLRGDANIGKLRCDGQAAMHMELLVPYMQS